MIVIGSLVLNTVGLNRPSIGSERIEIVNVSGVFSVVVSALGVTENDPVLLTIVKLPLLTAKSPELDTDQYSTELSNRPTVVTVHNKDAPSSTELATGVIVTSVGG